MKRSEVIELILATVNVGRMFSELVDKDEADDILKALEKAGMMPPDSGKGFMVSVNYGTKDANYEERKADHTWEPECEAPKCCGWGCHE